MKNLKKNPTASAAMGDTDKPIDPTVAATVGLTAGVVLFSIALKMSSSNS
jgi:hypothetical protein